MAASQMSHQMGQVEIMTQPLHPVEEEMSYDKHEGEKKNLKNCASKLPNKDNNDEYQSLTKCQALSKQRSKHFAHINS